MQGSMNSMHRIPKLIVFDLDYTLWPFWVDTHVTPPFTKHSQGIIRDRSQRVVSCYPDVPKILDELHSQKILLGIASRTSEILGANSLVSLFGWDKYFTFRYIFPTVKTEHFQRFQQESGIHFSEMLFFDDEERNIRDVSRLGVVSFLVNSGVSRQTLAAGLDKFARQNNPGSASANNFFR